MSQNVKNYLDILNFTATRFERLTVYIALLSGLEAEIYINDTRPIRLPDSENKSITVDITLLSSMGTRTSGVEATILDFHFRFLPVCSNIIDTYSIRRSTPQKKAKPLESRCYLVWKLRYKMRPIGPVSRLRDVFRSAGWEFSYI